MNAYIGLHGFDAHMGHYFYLDELRELFTSVHPLAPCENFLVAFSEQTFFQCFNKFEGFLCGSACGEWKFVVFHHWDRFDYRCSGDVARFAAHCCAGDGTTSVRVELVDGGVRFELVKGVEIVVDFGDSEMC